jgi:hypothetical protein
VCVCVVDDVTLKSGGEEEENIEVEARKETI